MIVGVIFHIVLEKTVFGYNIRATGGNRSAAAANGIRVARDDMALYAISGGVAALAGILGAARLSTVSPSAGGAGLTFQVVTAAIIGGTSLFAGSGTIAAAPSERSCSPRSTTAYRSSTSTRPTKTSSSGSFSSRPLRSTSTAASATSASAADAHQHSGAEHATRS